MLTVNFPDPQHDLQVPVVNVFMSFSVASYGAKRVCPAMQTADAELVVVL